MSFILRAAFWLTVLAFLLPSAKSGLSAQAQPDGNIAPASYAETQDAASDLDAGDMLKLAGRSAQDVMGFCDRNRDVCNQGGAVISHVADQTAYYGGKLVLWLTEKAQEQVSSVKNADTATDRPAPRSHPV